ncbi:MAG: hypothetical protein KBT36_01820 [Kurthia sp.]|nr:hypothetical protein [Candidatus Kurthia equi]
MHTLKIKDNTVVHMANFSNVEALTKRIANKTLEQLEKEGVFVFPDMIKEAEDISREQMILQQVNDSYQSSNVMGFIGYGKDRLVIESRFSTGQHDYFFQYLLEVVLDLPNIVDLETDATSENRLFNLLIFLFPLYLKAAMRKGAYKTYERNQYNDSHVKGTIDIARHMKQNTPFTGKIAYNQREFSYDNELMELIRHTIEFIKKKPYGQKLLVKAKDEVAAVIAVTTHYEYYNRRKISMANEKNPIRHAYYHEYRALQRLCILILQHKKHDIGSGSKQIHGILFDGAWLWEEYIHSLIGQHFYHPKNKGGKGAQQLFSSETRKVGLIYPDFLSKIQENRVIADAKYKPMGNIGNKDYLQVLAYMFRFDAKQGYYLYPESKGALEKELRMNVGSSYEDNVRAREDIAVTKLGLQIPKTAKNYNEFKLLMFKNEEIFKNQLVVD